MKKDLSKLEIDMAARSAHETNRAWNVVSNASTDSSWEDLTESEKQTSRNAVINIIVHDFDAEQTHMSWVAERQSQGWIVGETKDKEKKTHPCLVSWSALPMEMRVKDELWVGVVRSFVGHLWKLPQ